MAVLSWPVVLPASAPAPMAVFSKPVRVENERVISNRGVAPGGVVHEGLITDRRVATATDVVIKRINAVGRVANAVHVVPECAKTRGGIAAAAGVA